METETGVFNIRIECFKCDEIFLIPVKAVEYKKWQDGMSIQDAMPKLSKKHRELLISNVCAIDFAKMTDEFGNEDNGWEYSSSMEDCVNEWWKTNFH